MKELFIALAFIPAIASAQSSGPYRGPIIDVHLHAHTRDRLLSVGYGVRCLLDSYGVPVGIHTGGGPPRTPYTCCPKFRLSLGDPLLLEDLLVKHPKLKVYVMHAGGMLFGSDQMRWPEAIGLSIDRVNRLDFLTVEEKQDIFYDNAARFLGLTAAEIARHHR